MSDATITIRKNCEHCGKPFRPDPRYRSRACSAACRLELGWGGRRRPAEDREELPTIKECIICGVVIEGSGARIEHQATCSPECGYEAAARKQRIDDPSEKTLANRAYAERHPDRHAAQRAVQRALASGALVRPATCDYCDRFGKLSGHHDDYEKQLDVLWLCPPCHIQADRHRKYVEATRGPANDQETGE